MFRFYSFMAVAILGLAVLTACNSAENKNVSAGPIAPQPQNPTTLPSDGVRRVTVVELRDLLAKNEAVVYDVRNEEAYKTGHIRGAKLMPVADTVKHISELPKDKLIVTYCS